MSGAKRADGSAEESGKSGKLCTSHRSITGRFRRDLDRICDLVPDWNGTSKGRVWR